MRRSFCSIMSVVAGIWAQTTTNGLAQVESFTYRAPLEPFRIQQPNLVIHAQEEADLVIQRSVFTPGIGGWHIHPGPSFAIVLQGQLQLQKYSDKQGCVLSRVYGPGDVYIKPANELHRAIVLGEEDEVELIVRFNFPVGGAIGIPQPDPGCPDPLARAAASQAIPSRAGLASDTLLNFLVQEVEPFTVRATIDPYKIQQLPSFLMRSSQPSDIVVQRILFNEGRGGWHTHPGPSFVYVLDGQIRLRKYHPHRGITETPVYNTGQAYFEEGNEVHQAEVLSEGGALLLVARFNVPVGGPLSTPANGPAE